MAKRRTSAHNSVGERSASPSLVPPTLISFNRPRHVMTLGRKFKRDRATPARPTPDRPNAGMGPPA